MPDVQSQSLIDALNSQTGEVNFDVPGNGDCAIYAVIKLLLMRAAVDPDLRPTVRAMFQKLYDAKNAQVKEQKIYFKENETNSDMNRPDGFAEFMIAYDKAWENEESQKAFFARYCDARDTQNISDGDKELMLLIGCLRQACLQQFENICTDFTEQTGQESRFMHRLLQLGANPSENLEDMKGDIKKQFEPFVEMDARWLNLLFKEMGISKLMFDVQKVEQDGRSEVLSPDFDSESKISKNLPSVRISKEGKHFTISMPSEFAVNLAKNLAVNEHEERILTGEKQENDGPSNPRPHFDKMASFMRKQDREDEETKEEDEQDEQDEQDEELFLSIPSSPKNLTQSSRPLQTPNETMEEMKNRHKIEIEALKEELKKPTQQVTSTPFDQSTNGAVKHTAGKFGELADADSTKLLKLQERQTQEILKLRKELQAIEKAELIAENKEKSLNDPPVSLPELAAAAVRLGRQAVSETHNSSEEFLADNYVGFKSSLEMDTGLQTNGIEGIHITNEQDFNAWRVWYPSRVVANVLLKENGFNQKGESVGEGDAAGKLEAMQKATLRRFGEDIALMRKDENGEALGNVIKLMTAINGSDSDREYFAEKSLNELFDMLKKEVALLEKLVTTQEIFILRDMLEQTRANVVVESYIANKENEVMRLNNTPEALAQRSKEEALAVLDRITGVISINDLAEARNEHLQFIVDLVTALNPQTGAIDDAEAKLQKVLSYAVGELREDEVESLEGKSYLHLLELLVNIAKEDQYISVKLRMQLGSLLKYAENGTSDKVITKDQLLLAEYSAGNILESVKDAYDGNAALEALELQMQELIGSLGEDQDLILKVEQQFKEAIVFVHKEFSQDFMQEPRLSVVEESAATEDLQSYKAKALALLPQLDPIINSGTSTQEYLLAIKALTEILNSDSLSDQEIAARKERVTTYLSKVLNGEEMSGMNTSSYLEVLEYLVKFYEKPVGTPVDTLNEIFENSKAGYSDQQYSEDSFDFTSLQASYLRYRFSVDEILRRFGDDPENITDVLTFINYERKAFLNEHGTAIDRMPLKYEIMKNFMTAQQQLERKLNNYNQEQFNIVPVLPAMQQNDEIDRVQYAQLIERHTQLAEYGIQKLQRAYDLMEEGPGKTNLGVAIKLCQEAIGPSSTLIPLQFRSNLRGINKEDNDLEMTIRHVEAALEYKYADALVDLQPTEPPSSFHEPSMSQMGEYGSASEANTSQPNSSLALSQLDEELIEEFDAFPKFEASTLNNDYTLLTPQQHRGEALAFLPVLDTSSLPEDTKKLIEVFKLFAKDINAEEGGTFQLSDAEKLQIQEYIDSSFPGGNQEFIKYILLNSPVDLLDRLLNEIRASINARAPTTTAPSSVLDQLWLIFEHTSEGFQVSPDKFLDYFIEHEESDEHFLARLKALSLPEIKENTPNHVRVWHDVIVAAIETLQNEIPEEPLRESVDHEVHESRPSASFSFDTHNGSLSMGNEFIDPTLVVPEHMGLGAPFASPTTFDTFKNYVRRIYPTDATEEYYAKEDLTTSTDMELYATDDNRKIATFRAPPPTLAATPIRPIVEADITPSKVYDETEMMIKLMREFAKQNPSPDGKPYTMTFGDYANHFEVAGLLAAYYNVVLLGDAKDRTLLNVEFEGTTRDRVLDILCRDDVRTNLRTDVIAALKTHFGVTKPAIGAPSIALHHHSHPPMFLPSAHGPAAPEQPTLSLFTAEEYGDAEKKRSSITADEHQNRRGFSM